MLWQVIRAYFKPVVLIATLNAAAATLTVVAWKASQSDDANASPSVHRVSQNPCSYNDGDLPTQPSAMLKERATRVFENEREKPAADRGFLLALSTALKFQEYAQVEQLLNQYECGRKL